MKIGIVTFHFPYNCGAVLQCAALQRALELQGHEVCVVNYRPWYHQNRYTPFKNPFQFAKTQDQQAVAEGLTVPRRAKRWCGSFVRAVASYRHFAAKMPQNKKFEGFIARHLHCTKVYRTLSQLQNDPPKCGMFVSGSDQLWNVHITDKRFDEVYFLKFGPQNVGRITYAVGADFAECKDPKSELPALLDQLNAIALREMKCAPIIRECAPETPLFNTLDPTFLIPKEEYDGFMCKQPLETERFIFTYTMPNETQHKVYNAAKLLSKKTGLKVIDASGQPTKVNAKIEDHRLCGPDEFLWYMKHADYVLTNSFHGTAFSVIFEKQFFVIPHSLTGNRVTELLEKLGLSSRVAKTGNEAAQNILEPVDHTEARKNLGAQRAASLQYLSDSIEKYGNKQC